MPLPLEGMLVLDLTRLAPGPYCTWLLGDMGADVLKVEHLELGAVRQLASPLKLSETPPGFRAFAHALGQDSAAVLRELGYSDDRIRELREAGTVAQSFRDLPPISYKRGHQQRR